MDRLDGERGRVYARGASDPGMRGRSRAVEEVGVVANIGDAVVVRYSFEVRDCVIGGNGGRGLEGESGELGGLVGQGPSRGGG